MLLIDKLRNLLVMAAADGYLTEREINLLRDRCRRWGLSETDLADAVQYAMSKNAELTIPPQPEERREMLRDLIRMMAADGKLADVEKQLFALAAAHMDIAPQELDQLIDVMTDRV